MAPFVEALGLTNTAHAPLWWVGGDSYVITSLLSFAAGVVVSMWLLRGRFGPGAAGAAAGAGRRSTPRKIVGTLVANEEMQLALVVRKDLKMGTGKIAAQCSHAAVAIVEDVNAMRSQAEESGGAPPASSSNTRGDWIGWLDTWLATGSPKVALQCDSETSLLALAKAAKQASLPHYVIRDAGRTQIAAGSKTVVAIGPGPKKQIQVITGGLKLL